MPTLVEIAEHADVPIEGVVRVLMGTPVSPSVAERVQRAVDELGPPHRHMAEAASRRDRSEAAAGEVVVDRPEGDPTGPAARTELDETVERARETLLEAFAQAAAELETTLPQGVTSVVYEALRLEVQPVAQRMSQMTTLVEQLTRVVREVGNEVGAERRERLEDLELITELLVTGWQGVDRRLGRVERVLARLERGSPAGGVTARYDPFSGRRPGS